MVNAEVIGFNLLTKKKIQIHKRKDKGNARLDKSRRKEMHHAISATRMEGSKKTEGSPSTEVVLRLLRSV